MSGFGTIELVITMTSLLIVAALVLGLSKKLHFPQAVLLIIFGLLIAQLTPYMPATLSAGFSHHLTADFITYVCLPTLLFESAYSLDYRQLRNNLKPILALAIPGLLISTAIIGIIVAGFSDIPFTVALLLGAILSATDPVSVIAIFKQLGVPNRLTILVEGESLFNDATAIVTAKILLSIVLLGVFTSHHVWHGANHFILEFFGGIAVGWIIALAVGYILGFVKSDPYIEISLTTILAYGTFLVADHIFHVSGVMATIAAAFTLSSWGSVKISPSIAGYLKSFWSFMAYVINSVIFLLVGLSMNLNSIIQNWVIITLVVFAMLFARFVAIYGLIPLVNKIPDTLPINFQYQTVIFWGGIRGAIALAIVLSLPDFPQKELLISIVSGAVLFTLLVKGSTVEKLVAWFGLNKPTVQQRLSSIEAEIGATQQALNQIPALQHGGQFSLTIAQSLARDNEKRLDTAKTKLANLYKTEVTPDESFKLLYNRCLNIEKSQYHTLYVKGHIAEGVYSELQDEVTLQIDLLSFKSVPDCWDKRSHSVHHNLLTWITNQFINWIPSLRTQFYAKQGAKQYEKLWAQHQTAIEVMDYLQQLMNQSNVAHDQVQMCLQNYQALKEKFSSELDGIAEQFPEFVTSMQSRLAKRMSLQAKYDAIGVQVAKGQVSLDVAKSLQSELTESIYRLREKVSTKITLDVEELLRKVPFFENIPAKEFDQIASVLHSRITQTGEVIIKEGDIGDSLFLIMRGVIRVTKRMDDHDEDIATLYAGDFFGEISLIKHIPRVATCKAVTPCSLYELKKRDFDKLKQQYPMIEQTVARVAEERL